MIALTPSLLLGLALAHPYYEARQEEAPAEIRWHYGTVEEALSAARDTDSKVLVYFWMQGSEHCTRFYGETLQDGTAAKALAGHLCVSADLGTEVGAALFARYGVTQLPSTLFLGSDGAAEDVVLGFAPPAVFVGEVQRIVQGTNSVSDLVARTEAAPDDLALRLTLAQKFFDVGRADEARATLDSIRAADPEGRTLVGARLLLSDARDAVAAEASDPADVHTWKLGPLEAHVRGIEPLEVRFEGYDLLAQLRLARAEVPAAFVAWGRAFEHVPDPRFERFARELVEAAWAAQAELDGRAKRLFDRVSERLVTVVEERDAAEPDAAAADLEERLSLADALELRARALLVRKKSREARKVLERALELEPGHAAATARLAEL